MKYTIQYNGNEKYSYCLLDDTNRVVNAFLNREQAVFSKILNKEFRNVEMHKSMDDVKLRTCALNWQIESVEAVKC